MEQRVFEKNEFWEQNSDNFTKVNITKLSMENDNGLTEARAYVRKSILETKGGSRTSK